MNTLLFVAGLILLVLGAEVLVRGASQLAAALKIPPLVIGLTVVAFGTSAPELAVSVRAALAGSPEIAIGNVVGSNIFNVLFILGMASIISPLVVAEQVVRWDVPLMIVASVLVMLLALDRELAQWEGALLTLGLAGYTIHAFYVSRTSRHNQTSTTVRSGFIVQIAMILTGLVLLVYGARWLVDGAQELAVALGISPLIIGLTLVAAGTSLPEVATSVVAAARGERDIAVGNLIGSNLFNLFGVLGLSSLVAPAGVTVPLAALRFDLPVMVAVAIVCLPIVFTGHRISRGEGILLLGYYGAYVTYLILNATKHWALETYSIALLSLIIPMTVITLTVIAIRALRKGNQVTRPNL